MHSSLSCHAHKDEHILAPAGCLRSMAGHWKEMGYLNTHYIRIINYEYLHIYEYVFFVHFYLPYWSPHTIKFK